MRVTVLEHLVAAERQVAGWSEQRASDLSAEEALFLLATALVGGTGGIVQDPGNFCRLLLKLAFDGHFAPSEDFPFSQEELSAWGLRDGWQDILERRLTRADAKQMLRHTQEGLAAVERSPEGAFGSLNLWFGQVEATVAVRQGNFYGDVTETHIHQKGGTESVCLTLMTQAQYREVQSEQELYAGHILKAALMKKYGIELGNVGKAPEEPGDIEIAGYDVYIQHTKADRRPWPSVGKRGEGQRSYSKSEPTSQLFDELDGVVKAKMKYELAERAKLLLLLDSSILRIPKAIIEEYARARRATLVASGYGEIWYVCGFTEEAWCLLPRDTER